jgi:hypothetical protein
MSHPDNDLLNTLIAGTLDGLIQRSDKAFAAFK